MPNAKEFLERIVKNRGGAYTYHEDNYSIWADRESGKEISVIQSGSGGLSVYVHNSRVSSKFELGHTADGETVSRVAESVREFMGW